MSRTLLCVGDSLTYGTGSTPGNTYPEAADIVGGLHPWRQSKVENKINPGIKDLAGIRGFAYIDLYSFFKAGLDVGLRLYDDILPFDNGYQLIAETIGRAVEEVFVTNA